MPEPIIASFNNIGGLYGKREFKFQKGTNIILSRNAVGASSIVSGIACAIGGRDINDCVHELAKDATATVTMGKDAWSCHLTSTPHGTKIEEQTPLLEDPYSVYAIVVNEKHPLTILTDENVANFLKSISGIDKFEEKIRTLRQSIENLETKATRVEEETKALEPAHANYVRLCSQREKAELDMAKIAEQAKEAPKPSEAKIAHAKTLEEKLSTLEDKFKELAAKRDELAFKRDSVKSSLESQLFVKEKDESLKKLEEARVTKKHFAPKSIAAARYRGIYGSYVVLLRSIQKNNQALDEQDFSMECPFCSQFKKVQDRCTFHTVPIDTRIATFEDVLADKRKMQKMATGEMDKAVETVNLFTSKEEGFEQNITDLRKTLRTVMDQFNETNTQVEMLSGKRVQLQTELVELTGSLAIQRRVSEAETALIELRSKIDTARKEDDEYEAKQNELAEIKRNTDAKKQAFNTGKTQREEWLNKARLAFNSEATKVMKAVGFKFFNKIVIDETFTVKIMRTQDGHEYEEHLDELSSSETTTLTILLALAAKINYHPEVSLFIMDTLTSSLDKERFINLVDYIKTKVPCLIATLLSESEKDIRITHEVPA